MKQRRNAVKKIIAAAYAVAVVTTNVFSVSAFADNDKNKDKGNKKPSYSSEVEHGKPGHECSHDCDEKIGKGHHKDDDDYGNKNDDRDDDDFWGDFWDDFWDDDDDDDRWDDDDDDDKGKDKDKDKDKNPVVTTEAPEITTEAPAVDTEQPSDDTDDGDRAEGTDTVLPPVYAPYNPPVYTPATNSASTPEVNDDTDSDGGDDADDDVIEIEENEVPLAESVDEADEADESDEEASPEEDISVDSEDETADTDNVEIIYNDISMGGVVDGTSNPGTGVVAPLASLAGAGTAAVIAALTRKRRD